MKENCFALLAEFRRAETQSGANLAFFVQKRFELRSVIASGSTMLIILSLPKEGNYDDIVAGEKKPRENRSRRLLAGRAAFSAHAVFFNL
ncbi:MAG: hypothetical protein Q8N98_01485 [bacterium]|nr:hypothetical protein [bacterium]